MKTPSKNWLKLWLCAGALAAAAPSGAAETVKIGFIDLLSGPFALTGQTSLKQLREVVLQLNAKAGPNDPKFEVVDFDNKGTPQESLNALKAATDRGVRFITQGGGSGAALALVTHSTNSPNGTPNARRCTSTTRPWTRCSPTSAAASGTSASTRPAR